MTTALLGTGLIGAGLVQGLVTRGETVCVWNRSPGKAEALAPLGVRVAGTPEDAVRGATHVHLALSDDAAVDAVLDRVAPALAADALVLDHTTTQPEATARRATRVIEYLHAPVFMSPAMCAAAQGLMLCAGPRARFERAEARLTQMTGSVWYVGERPDLAAAYKLFGNAMILTIVGGLADVFAMAAERGIAAEEAYSVFSRFKAGATLDARGARMARGDFAPTFALTMARKDLRLMLDTAGDRPLAVLPGLAQRMDSVIAAGYGDLDLGALAAAVLGVPAPGR